MISSFYNTFAIMERFTLTTDDYNQPVKTWSMTTTIKGCKQTKSGDVSIVGLSEGIRTNERFYCDIVSITDNDRLLFSTNTYSYKGTAGASSDLTSTDYGALYFSTASFSSYIYGDYIRYSSVSTSYIKEEFSYYKILLLNNLEDRHLQIDLREDNENRT